SKIPNVRRFLRVGAATVLFSAAIAAATPPITPEDLLAHIKFLASDELKGRGNGSVGLEQAANYIARQFEAAGLTPAGASDGWFQPFELQAGLTVGEGNTLVVRSETRSVTLNLADAYYPMSAPANDSPALPSTNLAGVPLVFAGYGITAHGLSYDDYAGLDVDGKAVLIFSHEPQEHDRNSRLNGNQPVPESSLYGKAMAARNKGARVLIVVSDPTHQIDEANYRTFGIDPDAEDLGIPVLRARRDQLSALILGWGLDRQAALINNDLVPRSQPIAGARVDYRAFLTKRRRTVRNVVGILPGADPVRGAEAVVLGAHYDHVGVGGRFSMNPDRTGEIHNGADDNASGTASIIEIARAAAADPSRFPRTLVFVAFAGEERGLLGSAYYANNPPIPILNTVAMLNLDMMGRSRGSVDVSGLDMAPSLLADLNAAARVAGPIEIRHEGPGAGRSDDSSFIDRRVPGINFFTGFHSDYHRPTDDWQKVDAAGTARVATLALEFAARIAERRDRAEFVTPPRR
ncbi:MAG: M28 family peptidase, partial [Vicinamibacterales bacterium]